MKGRGFLAAVALAGIAIAAPAFAHERTERMPGPMSDETSLCSECHKTYHPGIVEDRPRSGRAPMIKPSYPPQGASISTLLSTGSLPLRQF